MNKSPRKSRVGFVVIKLSVSGTACFLMRFNSKWKDVNFIGGHEEPRDSGKFEKTARRELWEEVPSFRGYSDYSLEALTSLVHYGPIQSRSRGNKVKYEVQFFLLRINESPDTLIGMLGPRTKNILVPECYLLNQGRIRVSDLVPLLDNIYPGGLQNIPYSSPIELQGAPDRFVATSENQFELKLNL